MEIIHSSILLVTRINIALNLDVGICTDSARPAMPAQAPDKRRARERLGRPSTDSMWPIMSLSRAPGFRHEHDSLKLHYAYSSKHKRHSREKT